MELLPSTWRKSRDGVGTCFILLHVEILLLVSENTLPNVLPVGTNLCRPKNWNIGFGDESAGLSNCREDLAQAKIFILKNFHKVSPFPK